MGSSPPKMQISFILHSASAYLNSIIKPPSRTSNSHLIYLILLPRTDDVGLIRLYEASTKMYNSKAHSIMPRL